MYLLNDSVTTGKYNYFQLSSLKRDENKTFITIWFEPIPKTETFDSDENASTNSDYLVPNPPNRNR